MCSSMQIPLIFTKLSDLLPQIHICFQCAWYDHTTVELTTIGITTARIFNRKNEGKGDGRILTLAPHSVAELMQPQLTPAFGRLFFSAIRQRQFVEMFARVIKIQQLPGLRPAVLNPI